MESPKDIETVKTRTSSKWIGHDGILRVRFYAISELNIADAMTDAGVVAEMADGNQYPIIVDIRDIRKIGPKTRNYLDQRKNYDCLTKAAFLVRPSLVKRLMGVIPQNIKIKEVPTKSFGNEEDAIKWLLEK